MVKYGGNKTINYKYRREKFMKHKFLITGLATATILSATALTQLSSNVYANEEPNTTQPSKPVVPAVIKKAEADAKTAEDKVAEAQANVDAKTKEATAAATKLEAEKKEDTDAKAAKAEADKAKKDAEAEKTAADAELTTAQEEAKKADTKAQEEAKKADAKAKEDAAKKESLKGALEDLEKNAEAAINANNKILDKDKAIKEAKDFIGKEAILAAIEAGDITVDDAISNLPNEEDGKADEALKKEDEANKGNENYKKYY